MIVINDHALALLEKGGKLFALNCRLRGKVTSLSDLFLACVFLDPLKRSCVTFR
jgi:hypothetical protein